MHSKGKGSDAHTIRDAVRATSAAPTYFKPYRRIFIDGGARFNNPAVLGYQDYCKQNPIQPGIFISIGTGAPPRVSDSNPAKCGSGLLGEVHESGRIVRYAISALTDCQR